MPQIMEELKYIGEALDEISWEDFCKIADNLTQMKNDNDGMAA